jgi:pimeloyl-ACP methyl ester carboxylesterase
VPLLLVRGGTSPVVDDEDVAELTRRNPKARVVVVAGAGHSVQGDKPLELAEILKGLL